MNLVPRRVRTPGPRPDPRCYVGPAFEDTTWRSWSSWSPKPNGSVSGLTAGDLKERRCRPLGCHGPASGVSDFAVSPQGVQILLEHPREAATLVDLGDLEATLLAKPRWRLPILAALAEHIKERKVGASQWEKRNKRPLAESGWWRPSSDVQPLPIDAESIKPQDPESIMPQAPHFNDPSNRKSHKKGKKRHHNEEDEVVKKKSEKAKHAQDTAEEIRGVFN